MREIAALRERLSRLSEASLHITEDLDLDAVLQGVLDGARSLTGARMGSVTILDDSGQLQDFITSGGAGRRGRGLQVAICIAPMTGNRESGPEN